MSALNVVDVHVPCLELHELSGGLDAFVHVMEFVALSGGWIWHAGSVSCLLLGEGAVVEWSSNVLFGVVGFVTGVLGCSVDLGGVVRLWGRPLLS